MWYTVRKGQHRFNPRRMGLWPKLDFNVRFDFSCRYLLPLEDQTDTNKLFGVGYLPGHHTHSARWGWEYDPETDKVLLSAYVYSEGKRIDRPIGYALLGKKIRLRIEPFDKGYAFVVFDGTRSTQTAIFCARPWCRVGYNLGTYFGGNQTAPHEMQIELE